jgi:uncharacterized protein YegL
MRESLTEIVYVLDESGSMSTIATDAVGGLNAFIEDQKKVEGDANLTLVFFSNDYNEFLKSKSIKEVQPIVLGTDYQPRGMTALYDAIGKTIVDLGKRLSETPEDQRPSKVLFVIMTDGDENSSKEYTDTMIKEMIEHQSSVYNWEFIFSGANQDTSLNARSIGVNNWTAFSCEVVDGVAKSALNNYATLSKCATSYRGTGNIGDLPDNT